MLATSARSPHPVLPFAPAPARNVIGIMRYDGAGTRAPRDDWRRSDDAPLVGGTVAGLPGRYCRRAERGELHTGTYSRPSQVLAGGVAVLERPTRFNAR